MEWWGWLLIVVGVIVIGSIKVAVFKKMKQNKPSKNKFTDED